MIGLIQTVAPATEPVTLAEAQLWLRDPASEDDALITSLIAAARFECEHQTGRAFISQTWRLSLARFPAGRTSIPLPFPRLSSVSSITYVDTSGVTQTLSASDYDVDTHKEPGLVTPTYGDVWPVTRVQTNAVTITYIAGYGSLASTVPDGIKTAIKALVSHRYENRGDADFPAFVANMLVPYWIGCYALDPVLVQCTRR